MANQSVDKLFVETPDEGLVLNKELALPFAELRLKAEREAAGFLVETIRRWGGFFTYNHQKGHPEDEWTFAQDYGCWDDCTLCMRAGPILDKIFGDRRVFYNLPFVIHHTFAFNLYMPVFSFGDLKEFAEGVDKPLSKEERDERTHLCVSRIHRTMYNLK